MLTEVTDEVRALGRSRAELTKHRGQLTTMVAAVIDDVLNQKELHSARAIYPGLERITD